MEIKESGLVFSFDSSTKAIKLDDAFPESKTRPPGEAWRKLKQIRMGSRTAALCLLKILLKSI